MNKKLYHEQVMLVSKIVKVYGFKNLMDYETEVSGKSIKKIPNFYENISSYAREIDLLYHVYEIDVKRINYEITTEILAMNILRSLLSSIGVHFKIRKSDNTIKLSLVPFFDEMFIQNIINEIDVTYEDSAEIIKCNIFNIEHQYDNQSDIVISLNLKGINLSEVKIIDDFYNAFSLMYSLYIDNVHLYTGLVPSDKKLIGNIFLTPNSNSLPFTLLNNPYLTIIIHNFIYNKDVISLEITNRSYSQQQSQQQTQQQSQKHINYELRRINMPNIKDELNIKASCLNILDNINKHDCQCNTKNQIIMFRNGYCTTLNKCVNDIDINYNTKIYNNKTTTNIYKYVNIALDKLKKKHLYNNPCVNNFNLLSIFYEDKIIDIDSNNDMILCAYVSYTNIFKLKGFKMIDGAINVPVDLSSSDLFTNLCLKTNINTDLNLCLYFKGKYFKLKFDKGNYTNNDLTAPYMFNMLLNNDTTGMKIIFLNDKVDVQDEINIDNFVLQFDKCTIYNNDIRKQLSCHKQIFQF